MTFSLMSEFLISRSDECNLFSCVAVSKSRIVKTELIFANLFCLAPCEEAPQFNGIKSHADVLVFFPAGPQLRSTHRMDLLWE